MNLTGAQRRKLKALAHSLDPVVRIGQRGLTAAVLEEINQALEAHELIKIRFQDFKDEKETIVERIEQNLDATAAGIVGHIVILYRQHPDPEERTIELS